MSQIIRASADVTGTIQGFVTQTLPSGWLECDGSQVSRVTYAALFAFTGILYGAGDGATTFNLPDFRSRSLLGRGAPGDLTQRFLGGIGGAEVHQLGSSEMPVHGHTATVDSQGTHQHESLSQFGVNGPQSTIDGGAPIVAGVTGAAGLHAHNITVQNSGSGAGHNNMHPFAVVVFGVKT